MRTKTCPRHRRPEKLQQQPTKTLADDSGTVWLDAAPVWTENVIVGVSGSSV